LALLAGEKRKTKLTLAKPESAYIHEDVERRKKKGREVPSDKT